MKRADSWKSILLRLAAQQLRKIAAHDLVPLELAVLSVFRSVYDERHRHQDSGRKAAHLDALASTFAAMRPIYAYQDDGASLRQISSEELFNALFRGGGREAHFLDGRPPIRGLAVAAKDTSAVVEALKRAAA